MGEAGTKFEWGQRVRAVADLVDDGTHPAAPPGGRLVALGSVGEVVRIGRHEETAATVYLVEFPGPLIVGCCEEELDVA